MLYCGTDPRGQFICPGIAGTVLTSNGVDQAPEFLPAGSSSGFPVGGIIMWSGLLSAIPVGWNLCDGNNGTPDLRSVFIKGSAAGIDPGVTGGSTTHTPTGTINTPTFTGTGSQSTSAVSAGTPDGTVSTPIFIGNAVTSSAISGGTPAGTISGVAINDHASHTHTYTQVPNHVHVQNVNTGTTGSQNGYGVDTSTTGSTATGISTANPTGGVATGTTAGPSATLTHTVSNNGTFSGSALSTHTHDTTATGTNSTPTFTGSALGTHSHTITPTGTISQPSFTGDDANYEPAFYSLAFIMKAA